MKKIMLAAVLLSLGLTACFQPLDKDDHGRPGYESDNDTVTSSETDAAVSEDTEPSDTEMTEQDMMVSVSEGYFLPCRNGTMLVINDKSGAFSVTVSGNEEEFFQGLSAGDKIRLAHGVMLETYPGMTEGFSIEKISDGDISDIPADVIANLEEMGYEALYEEQIPLAAGQVNYRIITVRPECGPSIGFSFGLPAGWTCESIMTEDDPTGSIFTKLYDSEEKTEEHMVLGIAYSVEPAGLCGTGLEQKQTDFNGCPAYQGFYYGNENWSFIFLEGEYEGCRIFSYQSDTDKYSDTVDMILSTLRFEKYGEGPVKPVDDEPLSTDREIFPESGEINGVGYSIENGDYYNSVYDRQGYRISGGDNPDEPFTVSISCGEKPTGGYSAEVSDIRIDNEKNAVIYVRVNSPAPTETVTEAFTYPVCHVMFSEKMQSISIKDMDGNEYEMIS